MIIKHNGYTLIELLVVMAIAALLFGFSFAAYTNFNKGRQLEQAANDVVAVLKDAQHRAISGEMDTSAGLCNPSTDHLLYWHFNWGFGALKKLYSISGSCAGSNTFFFGPASPYTFPVKGNIKFYNTGQISYSPFIQGTDAEKTICITDNSGQYYKIRVKSPSGEIDVRIEGDTSGCT